MDERQMNPDAAPPENYVTVIPVDYNNHSNHLRSHQRRSSSVPKSGSSQNQKKKARMRSDLDPDYRDYFRERPRGEFLTRGAALASQQSQEYGARSEASANPVYSVGQAQTRAMLSSAMNSDLQHEQLEREPRRYIPGSSAGPSAAALTLLT